MDVGGAASKRSLESSRQEEVVGLGRGFVEKERKPGDWHFCVVGLEI